MLLQEINHMEKEIAKTVEGIKDLLADRGIFLPYQIGQDLFVNIDEDGFFIERYYPSDGSSDVEQRITVDEFIDTILNDKLNYLKEKHGKLVAIFYTLLNIE